MINTDSIYRKLLYTHNSVNDIERALSDIGFDMSKYKLEDYAGLIRKIKNKDGKSLEELKTIETSLFEIKNFINIGCLMKNSLYYQDIYEIERPIFKIKNNTIVEAKIIERQEFVCINCLVKNKVSHDKIEFYDNNDRRHYYSRNTIIKIENPKLSIKDFKEIEDFKIESCKIEINDSIKCFNISKIEVKTLTKIKPEEV